VWVMVTLLMLATFGHESQSALVSSRLGGPRRASAYSSQTLVLGEELWKQLPDSESSRSRSAAHIAGQALESDQGQSGKGTVTAAP
jgi:hypothetical protein